jgi:zinc D-Ala-D-Ala carboxypeptidase
VGWGLRIEEGRNNRTAVPRMIRFSPSSYFASALTALVALLLVGTVSAKTPPREDSSLERVRLATELLSHHRVSCLDFHISRNPDSATAQDNLEQTAGGAMARRSSYGTGPGGWTTLDLRMLRALVALANEGYSFRLTELAGGSHSRRSRHYEGVAFDIDTLNGRKVRPGHPSYRRFLKRCREFGATEVLGPGVRGHSSHLHVAWPRI